MGYLIVGVVCFAAGVAVSNHRFIIAILLALGELILARFRQNDERME